MHVRMKKFAIFQQNYMIVFEMADNRGAVCVLLVLCVCVCVCFFFGHLNINLCICHETV